VKKQWNFTIYTEWRWFIVRTKLVYIRRYMLQPVRRCCNGSCI
jgi:hypothetical protein